MLLHLSTIRQCRPSPRPWGTVVKAETGAVSSEPHILISCLPTPESGAFELFSFDSRCLTQGRVQAVVSFYDKVTLLVDRGKAVDVVYLGFSQDFDNIYHSILPEKLDDHGFYRHMLLWVKN